MATETGSGELIWAYLVHLGYNMWCDHEHNLDPNGPSHIAAKDYLRFDEPLWRELLPRMRDAGVNMVVIDIGEGLRYESHPELAVKGSWPREKLEEELAVCREFGLEPIPKLNFSACHDVWLGPYSRMLSTKPYYDVVRDVITEVSDIFKTPRFFHLGMDEETAVNQIYNRLTVIRQFDLYWHDLNLLCDAVRGHGARPWIWSDYQWYHPLDFAKNMRRDVLQSNWWYYKRVHPATVLIRANPQVMDDPVRPRGNMTKPLRLKPVQAYLDLEKLRMDQVPTGGITSKPVNFAETVKFCRKNIAARRLYGFMQTSWRATLEQHREQHMSAIAAVGDVIAKNR